MQMRPNNLTILRPHQWACIAAAGDVTRRPLRKPRRDDRRDLSAGTPALHAHRLHVLILWQVVAECMYGGRALSSTIPWDIIKETTQKWTIINNYVLKCVKLGNWFYRCNFSRKRVRAVIQSFNFHFKFTPMWLQLLKWPCRYKEFTKIALQIVPALLFITVVFIETTCK